MKQPKHTRRELEYLIDGLVADLKRPINIAFPKRKCVIRLYIEAYNRQYKGITGRDYVDIKNGNKDS